MITIYIDALSRIAFAKKMPKTFKWFEKFHARNTDKFTVHQGMRANALAPATYHNALAYFYGVHSMTKNVFKNSRFSVTEKAMDAETEEVIDARTGKKTVRQVLLINKSRYKSVLSDIRNAGYITAMTSTDCAASPLSDEYVNYLDFLEANRYDHMGLVPSCDPNYFMPTFRDSAGGGPYSVYRRCLYGVEMVDYTFDYAKEFLKSYHD
jgi:hypothetical protein